MVERRALKKGRMTTRLAAMMPMFISTMERVLDGRLAPGGLVSGFCFFVGCGGGWGEEKRKGERGKGKRKGDRGKRTLWVFFGGGIGICHQNETGDCAAVVTRIR